MLHLFLFSLFFAISPAIAAALPIDTLETSVSDAGSALGANFQNGLGLLHQGFGF